MHIQIVSPSSCVDIEQIQRAQIQLQQLGHQISLSEHCTAQHRYLAGTAAQRIADLKQAMLDPSIDAVWCARGGTGAAQLLPAMDDWILNKPLIGYSDSTVLLNTIAMRGGQALHGPVFQEIAVKNTAEHAVSADALAVLKQLQHPHVTDLALEPLNSLAQHHTAPLHGKLLGGNLTVLASLQGTQGALVLEQDSILLLEDVGEPFYRLERSLDQLFASIDISRVKALVMGDFYQCPQKNVPHSLQQIFAEHCDAHAIALYENQSFGHGHSNQPFWIGMDVFIQNQSLGSVHSVPSQT